MQNTVIVAYRNRPEHLKLFLQALSVTEQPSYHQLLIYDLGADPLTQQIVNGVGPAFDTRILQPDEPATAFHKTKALNAALRATETEYCTVLDVDCLAQPYLLDRVTDYFECEENKRIKLGYRIRHLDSHTTDQIKLYGIDYFARYVLIRPEYFNNTFYESHNNIKGGNSHYTMLTKVARQVGYDERYIGYGNEDVDFNLRAHRIVGDTPIFEWGEFFHLWHKPSYLHDDPLQRDNLKLYIQNKAAGFPDLPPLMARQ